ncbi:MAG TPA: hypothetical protein VIX73_04955, partial [Kofleriaceae bacterium]
PRDAEVTAAAPPDAAETFGALTALHHGARYLNVIVDGRLIGPTPIFRHRIATGAHTVELIDPRTTDVVVTLPVKVKVGETVTVSEP